MYVVGVTGEGAETVADRLTDRFGESGTVGTVRREPDASGAPAPSGSAASFDAAAETAFELGDGWRARGQNKSVADVLDLLAPAHEYAVVVGFPDADIPRIVLGDADCSGEVLTRAASPDALDIEAVVTALEATEPHETLESLVARVKRDPEAERSGAIATFTGRVRAKDSDDDSPTEFLDFEMYDGVAQEKLDAIRSDLEAREGVFSVLMHHRTGRIDYGEDIVFVVVLAGHRGEAFRTVEDGIDRLKAEVPIFKKEVTLDEQFWVHDR
ncbi:molybdenum cofactor biosynthesis protein MoaE [Haladaptatus sp. R4]|uniref:molybdopterin synthase n=1 Tax=Haladaptatus sp. R4 TaxID=1679489 RepID=UPI0007B4AF80|nr:molybdopterin synthase [Haladaptatus sp. R4]KZN25415.1 molybdenum cofactor biosynthesis protein MoaE [Haladaptatus sp. R4]